MRYQGHVIEAVYGREAEHSKGTGLITVWGVNTLASDTGAELDAGGDITIPVRNVAAVWTFSTPDDEAEIDLDETEAEINQAEAEGDDGDTAGDAAESDL